MNLEVWDLVIFQSMLFNVPQPVPHPHPPLPTSDDSPCCACACLAVGLSLSACRAAPGGPRLNN